MIFLSISNSSLILGISKFFNSPIPAADKSLAIPLIPRASALFGVMAISITGSDLLM